MKENSMFKRFIAIILSLTMILGMVPASVFADNDFEMSPLDFSISTRDAEGDIPSGNIANDARNAVHAFVGVQTGGDLNWVLSDVTGEQFKPLAGIKGYFQWFERGGYVSPVYSAISDANGRLNIDCKPYVASDGKLIKFDADPTVSAGFERYKFWVEKDTIPEGYQLQYVTGNQVIFPNSDLTITQGGSGSNTIKNTHENWKILLMEKPKPFMHKTPSENSPQQSGGYQEGKVSWDFQSPVGGLHFSNVANHTVGAEGVTVRASYLSDYAMKQIYSDGTAAMLSVAREDIRGKGWTAALERQLQEWIKLQVQADPENWIAETVSAQTDANGEYVIQFKGIWGDLINRDAGLKDYTYKVGDKAGGIAIGNRWTQEQIDRLGKLADSASDGIFALGEPKKNQIKHINYDWMFVSIDNAENLRVMTPYNNNTYAAMNSDWGINAGWSVGAVRTGVTNAFTAKLRSDFAIASPEIDFHITNYDSNANTAIPGDIAQTSTDGLPYSYNGNLKYRISWYDDNDKLVKTGTPQIPTDLGEIDSEPFDTTDVERTTEFTAKLYRLDENGKDAELIAVDSFTVEVSHLFISRYDEVNIPNPKADDDEMKNARYYATDLPKDLNITLKDGTITGKAKTSGVFKVNFRTVLPDESGDIEGTRNRYIAVTDSPLAKGEVGVAYSQKVIPEPTKDPKEKDYFYFMRSVKFLPGKEIDGLSISGDADVGFTISGTPTEVAEATEDVLNGDPGPNVEVTYDIYKTNDQGNQILVSENHKDLVPLVIESERLRSDPVQKYDEDTDNQYIEGTLPEGKTLPDGSTVELVKKVGDDYVKVDVPVSTDNNKLTVDVKNNNIVDGEVYYFAITQPGRDPAYSNNPVKVDKKIPTLGESGNEITLVQDIYTYKVKISANASDDSGILRLYAEEDKDSGYYDSQSKEKSANLTERIEDQLAKEKEYKVTAVDKFGNKNIVTQNLQPKTQSLVINADRPISGKNYIYVKANPGTKLKIEVINSDKSKALTMTYTQQSQRDKIQLNSLTLAKGQKIIISAYYATNKTTLTVRVR